MKATPAWRSLRVALVVSHVVVALLGMLAMLVVAQFSSGAFYDTHLAAMSGTYGGQQPDQMHQELQQGFSRALGLSLLFGLLIGLPVALLAGAWLARRVLRPVAQISQAAQGVARGGYHQRLPETGNDELSGLMQEFNRLAASLEATETRRTELVSAVAHELRTPLVGLRGYAEGLEDGLFAPQEVAKNMRHEVGRLSRLVQDLEEVSRSETGGFALVFEEFDVVALCEDLGARYAPLFEGRLVLDLPNGAVLVRADPDRVTQVLVNLLGNALRHAPNASTTLGVQTINGLVQMRVSDQGPGIPAEILPRIFERFYRADPSRSGGGTGVGLTISQHLMRAMHGDLGATSTPESTSFVASLPASRL